jgi:hypothetical protein
MREGCDISFRYWHLVRFATIARLVDETCLFILGIRKMFDFPPTAKTVRQTLEENWLTLTRQTLPKIAAQRKSSDAPWPVENDHCFMRILLDAVHGQRWDAVVKQRPAYRHMDQDRLAKAIALGEAVVSGEVDLWVLNAQSLAWRRKGALK